MILQEFERFLTKLGSDTVPDDVRRIGNIININIKKIAPLGTANGSRSKKIIELAQKEFLNSSPIIHSSTETVNNDEILIKRLKNIKIESFRGFSKQEEFDLDAPIVLLYGPNGSGKSSFCEALEYSLLGFVEEAEVKRFSNATDYLKNARSKKFVSPILSGYNDKNETISISSDDEKFRFCFVEKNRIDDFSRMAAKVPAQQNKLIGTLFGLELFDEFVKGFSTELDSKYIDLSGKKTKELAEKKNEIKVAEQIVNSSGPELEELTKSENKTVSEFREGMNYTDFVKYLGTQENSGRIQELEQLTEKQISKKIGFKLTSLVELDNALADCQNSFTHLTKELETKKNQISFRNLYNAVKELFIENPNICPACSTPLENVSQNPYTRAENGLKDLEHLTKLEEQLEIIKDLNKKKLSELFHLVKTIASYAESVSDSGSVTFKNILLNPENEVTIEWWHSLKQQTGKEKSLWQEFEIMLNQIEKHDNEITRIESERNTNLEELRRLRMYRETVVRHEEARKTKTISIEQAKSLIEKFENDNKELIDESKKEKSIVETNKRIADAYSVFINSLNAYRKNLPALLVADLSEIVKNLYNGFNRSDPPGDLLYEIRLPLASGGKIEIAFSSDPSQFFDALHVLSEGHIRCLGLSILLAKNIKQECPFLIFDDPVNAIDDDHREGIRRTIFEDGLFDDKQVILTCHGEEFLKDIQNLLGIDRSKNTNSFSFIPHVGDNIIQVFSSRPRNYTVIARDHFMKGEIRDSLSNSRRALEYLANGTWRLIAKYGDSNISLSFRDPKGKPELRNLVDQLSRKMGKDFFTHVKRDVIISAYSTLLGIDGQSPEWRYLNKGTHEEADRPEFNRATVELVIKSLEVIDSVISNKKDD